MIVDELREKYLAFFASKGHVRVSSAKLVPENDPTTLFTGSGMQPMMPYLLGQPHPQGKRIVDSQKSFRVTDIDEVGDNRHTTFFEMLGNWSLGDYWKEEQLSWIFEFLIEIAGLDPNKLYVTVFAGDDASGIPRDEESVAIWQMLFAGKGITATAIELDSEERGRQAGMQGGRIFYYGVKKNWWSRAGVPNAMPAGEPGGPDSEIFYLFDAIEHDSKFGKECHPNCDCGRYLEIGNSVFMEYLKNDDGSFSKLKQRNVDFGGGLERIAATARNDPDVFRIDAFNSARAVLEKLSGQTYGQDTERSKAFRVLLDHLRAATFLMADGVLPSNKDQGYFVRRLLRRAIRYAHALGISASAAQPVAEAFIAYYEDIYPELEQGHSTIIEAIIEEENKFRATLAQGLRTFTRATESLSAGDNVPTELVFDLYQSFGFPLEMAQELAIEKGLLVDTEAFKKAFAEHQTKSRVGAEKKFKGGLADHSEQSVNYHTATHLLHQALREVLGSHVLQQGSNITRERLRFDFSHPQKMSPQEVQAVEDLVNKKIQEDLPVRREEMSVTEAKSKGALGLFAHKYATKVSVYSIGDFSCEICGGPHVAHTGELGRFRITKEESASGGIRRLKAVLE